MAGHERVSSPFFKFTDTGLLTRVPGNEVQGGGFYQVSAQGGTDMALTELWRLNVSAALDEKRSTKSPALNYQMASVDGALRVTHTSGTYGLGPSVQKLSIAGQPFRTTLSTKADWTLADQSNGFLSAVLERGSYRHADLFTELDAAVSAVNLIRHLGHRDVDLMIGYRKEQSDYGFSDLSNRSVYLRVAASATRGQWTGTIALMGQRARYEASLIDPTRARRDAFRSLDLALSYPLSASARLRFDWSHARNTSNDLIYDNTYQQTGVSLTHSF